MGPVRSGCEAIAHEKRNGFQCQDCGSLKFSIRHDIYRANKSYKDVLAGSVRVLSDVGY